MSGAVVAGAIAVSVLGAVPANAEGKRSTYISYWSTGQESSRWQDNNTDASITAVKFSNCTAPSSPGKRASALISLRKDVVGPDPHRGQSGDVCTGIGKRWGDESAGKYYFTLDRINGTQGPGNFHLDANPVEIWY
ncbi:hypothetical protein [Streptomyces sp. NPDC058657]|uniref:hypothetical protein n=1 Tax=unclassified Streptomyces TaxID=2593676 RepID=UPI00366975A6